MVHGRKASPTAVAGGPETAEEGELALLQRVAAGDRAAFELLYRCYFPRLTRFLGRVLQRPHTVEEVLNDAMLVVWRKAASFNGQSRISTWIFAIAYRRALKAIKRFDDPIEFDEEQAESLHPGPDAALMHRQLSATLAWAIARMPADHRAVIELTYFHGCRYQEIAQIMGCPVGTVKTRMFHARRRLQLLLSDRMEDLP
jgi:RNA polymerase sigma-70 factor (ECF subfamily)